MKLSFEQVRMIRAGQAVEVEDAEVGETCLVVLAKSVRRSSMLDDLHVPMEVVSQLVDEGMAEYDEGDPLLERYQIEERSRATR